LRIHHANRYARAWRPADSGHRWTDRGVRSPGRGTRTRRFRRRASIGGGSALDGSACLTAGHGAAVRVPDRRPDAVVDALALTVSSSVGPVFSPNRPSASNTEPEK